MAERVVLHVGLLKTGTSYLQRRLWAGRTALRENGLLFPAWRQQVDAVIDVLGIRRRPRPGEVEGAWERMVSRLDAWPGVGLMSMEFLGPARPPQIEKVVGSLGSGQVEVVITARDLNRAIAAMWQETAKNGGTEPWPSYVEAIEENTGAGTRFWRQQRLALIVRNWADVVGLENVTVVTVPPPGAPAETLWERFCEAARIDPALCPPSEPANESLGAPSAEVLRRVNELLGPDELSWAAYSKAVKFGFAKQVLAPARAEEPALGMPVPDWVVARSASMRRNVADTGVRVIGALDDLTPVPGRGTTPDQVAVEDVLDAAVRALAALLRRDSEQVASAVAAAPAAGAGAGPAAAQETDARPVE